MQDVLYKTGIQNTDFLLYLAAMAFFIKPKIEKMLKKYPGCRLNQL